LLALALNEERQEGIYHLTKKTAIASIAVPSSLNCRTGSGSDLVSLIQLRVVQ